MMKTRTYTLPNTENIVRQQLPNGLTILIYENPAVKSVVLRGSLRAGSIYETPKQNGLASLTADALMQGTKTRDFDTIYSSLEDIGAELQFNAGQYRAHFSGRALAEDMPILVELLADSLRNPVFPAEELAEEQTRRLTELHYAEQDTRYRAIRLFYETLYPAHHPYHYATYGSVKTLPTITQADLQEFHTKHYGADGMILTVVGAVNADEVAAQIGEALADWHNPTQPAVPTLPQIELPRQPIERRVSIAGKSQADVVIGSVGPSRYADDFLAASVANSILGEFAMMGRVGDVIREQLGLAYYAYSRLEGGEGPGAWQVMAGVSPENVALTIEKAQAEIKRMTMELVTEAELDDNQSYFTGRLPLRLESNSGIANILEALERYGLGLDYLVNYSETIRSITRDNILAAAQRYLRPENLVIAVAEPEE